MLVKVRSWAAMQQMNETRLAYTIKMSIQSSCAVMDLLNLKEWVSDGDEGVWSWNVTERKLGNGNDCIGRNENRLDGKIRFCQQIKHFYANSGKQFFIYSHICHLSQTSDIKHAKKGSVCQTARSQRRQFA